MNAETFTLVVSALAGLVSLLLMVISFFLVRLVNSVDYIRDAFTVLKTEFTEHKKNDSEICKKVEDHAKAINKHETDILLLKQAKKK